MPYSKEQLEAVINLSRNKGFDPVIHPNGFIQLKTGLGRLHFWHPKLPRQKRKSPVHDHVFNMHSEVQAGSVINEDISVCRHNEGYFDLYVAVPVDGANTDLVRTSIRCEVNRQEPTTYEAGDRYTVQAGDFHETKENPKVRGGAAITLMQKSGEQADIPRILIPHGQEPDNEFKRDDFSPIWLYETIDKILTICFDDFHEFDLPGETS